MVGDLVVEAGAQVVVRRSELVALLLQLLGTHAQQLGAFAPHLEPGLVVADAVAQRAAHAVHLGEIGATIGRGGEDRHHLGGPAVVAGVVLKVLRRGGFIGRVHRNPPEGERKR
jgi:hypothetical protein